MALLTWNDSYSVKVKQFDDQHKKLVDMINKLHDAMKVGKGTESSKEILGSLVSYTQTHFNDEEKLMKQHGYPYYEQHKKEHNQLVMKVADVKKLIDEGKMLISQELMQFLKDWLVKHIQGEDQKYGPFLNSKGVS